MADLKPNSSVIVPTARMIDAVFTYGWTMTSLVNRQCKEVAENLSKSALRKCLTGEVLYEALLNMTFTGITGQVSVTLTINSKYSEK